MDGPAAADDLSGRGVGFESGEIKSIRHETWYSLEFSECTYALCLLGDMISV